MKQLIAMVVPVRRFQHQLQESTRLLDNDLDDE